MVAILALIALILLTGAMYARMRRQPDRRSMWRMAIYIGIGTGALRAALSSLGWYVVEHDGGPLQVPAFALAMMAWPEAAVLAQRRTTPAPPYFYLQLSLLLMATTLGFAAAVAWFAGRRRIAGRE